MCLFARRLAARRSFLVDDSKATQSRPREARPRLGQARSLLELRSLRAKGACARCCVRGRFVAFFFFVWLTARRGAAAGQGCEAIHGAQHGRDGRHSRSARRQRHRGCVVCFVCALVRSRVCVCVCVCADARRLLHAAPSLVPPRRTRVAQTTVCPSFTSKWSTAFRAPCTLTLCVCARLMRERFGERRCASKRMRAVC